MNEHCDDGNVERLKFLLSEMETELVMNNWDLRVTASIGSAVIHDNYIDSEGERRGVYYMHVSAVSGMGS